MNFNILLVEDNSNFRQMLADTLLTHFTTINIEEVDNGEDALIKAGDLHPDMIFMDISLPGESGLEATRKIKMRHEHTLVVILTSYDMPEYRQQAFRNGADYFLSKADDSSLANIIAWIEKAVADKNTQIWQERSTASHRAFLRQRMSGITVSLPNAGSFCVSTFNSPHPMRCSLFRGVRYHYHKIIPRIAHIGVA